jgi:hypothetical protein
MRRTTGALLAGGLAGLTLLLVGFFVRGRARDDQPTASLEYKPPEARVNQPSEAQDQPSADGKPAAPAFEGISTWINSKPLAWKDLRGQVVAVHFWTFG